MRSQTYCIVSPVRNEEKFMRRTLDAIVEQTTPPDLWIIVDDGSTDQTPAILAEYAARHSYIHVVKRVRDGARRVGAGVVEAFYDGLSHADVSKFDFICKLDLDLDLPRGYFARVLALMDADPRLGTVSGKAYFPGPSNPDGRFDGELISENIGDDVSLGMVKLWRRQCFDDIGGIVRGVLWDGIDCYRARMLGWKAYSTDEPELRFVHLRPMGASHNGIITGRQRWGSGHWFMGSSPLFVLATAVNRARYRPRVVGGMAMVWGYIKAALRRDPRLSDAEFRSYLRKYQWRMMTRGKPAAVREFDQLGEPRWRAAHASHQH